MNPTVVQNLINDSAGLVDASIEIEKQAELATQKVASLTAELDSAKKQIGNLTKQADDFSAQVRAEAEKTADALIGRGFQIKRAEFIDRLAANPIEMFGVIDKVAREAIAPQMGIGAGEELSGTIDPIQRFAFGE